jgi:putative redox protein
VGNNTGGSLALCVAADDPRVNGCALLGARADFDDWAEQPRRFLEHSREIGSIRRPSFPPSVEEWGRELRRFRPTDAARRFAPRPLFLMHGQDDDIVPTADSRVLAQAHGAAELQIIPGAGHRLRHDPRAMAVLLGWLDRQRTLAAM